MVFALRLEQRQFHLPSTLPWLFGCLKRRFRWFQMAAPLGRRSTWTCRRHPGAPAWGARHGKVFFLFVSAEVLELLGRVHHGQRDQEAETIFATLFRSQKSSQGLGLKVAQIGWFCKFSGPVSSQTAQQQNHGKTRHRAYDISKCKVTDT